MASPVWFHGTLEPTVAEHRLEAQPVGTFLVYTSQSGQTVLAVRGPEQTVELEIEPDSGSLAISGVIAPGSADLATLISNLHDARYIFANSLNFVLPCPCLARGCAPDELRPAATLPAASSDAAEPIVPMEGVYCNGHRHWQPAGAGVAGCLADAGALRWRGNNCAALWADYCCITASWCEIWLWSTQMYPSRQVLSCTTAPTASRGVFRESLATSISSGPAAMARSRSPTISSVKPLLPSKSSCALLMTRSRPSAPTARFFFSAGLGARTLAQLVERLTEPVCASLQGQSNQ
eukprot:m.65861 g.65861  ORF g.65861 m.65861 type:complete len:293 (-) comp7596_c0_seq2:913-1791(-)